MSTRSTRPDVRNPMLKIAEVREQYEALPPEARAALMAMLKAVSKACRTNADKALRTRKPPMYAYWQANAVNARHLALAGRAATTANKPAAMRRQPEQQG